MNLRTGPVWVIDIHVHVGDFSQLRDDIQRLLLGYGRRTSSEVAETFGSPVKLANLLEGEGIYRAALLTEEGPATNFHITNDFVAEFVRAAGSSTLLPFAGINPNIREEPQAVAEKALRNGARGFKLYPADHDFDPLTPAMMNAYRVMAEAGTPLMFHTGSSAQRGCNMAFANPEVFAPIMAELPDLPVVLCHAGLPNFGAEARRCLSRFSNCHVDTALVKVADLMTMFPDIEAFADRILFGSDWPAGGCVRAAWQAYFDAGLPERVVRKVLCENAARLLRVPVPEPLRQPVPVS